MSTALVTGGSRGIGRAIALRLAQDGHDVAVGYASNNEAAELVANEIRSHDVRVTTVRSDLAQVGGADELVDLVERKLGGIDILIANAGVSSDPTGFRDITIDDWERMLAINLRAPFLLARRVVPGMIKRSFGRVVLISSIAAYTGGLVGAHYAASKAGLHGLAYKLAQETAPHGVTVNVVAPALIETDLIPDDPAVRQALASSTPVGRLGQPLEVADMVAAIVGNGYMTGQSVLLDGGRHPT